MDKIQTDPQITSDIKYIQRSIDLATNWFELLVKELIMKQITNRVDTHVGNLGVNKQKEFRYFDPAYIKPMSL